MLKLFATALDGSGQLANASRRPLLVTLTITCSLGLVASTIYVPSIPAIADALGTTVSRVQLTFVAYLAAFALSMLVLGPLSDRCGRRRTMILGVSLSALGSIACAASPTIECLMGARILQGIGLSGGMVVGRATIRDVYGEEGAAQIIAGLSILLTLLQAFAQYRAATYRHGLVGRQISLQWRFWLSSLWFWCCDMHLSRLPERIWLAPKPSPCSPEPCWPAIAA